MIIVSQDRTRIVNFERVEILGIDLDNERQIVVSFSNYCLGLGTYKTEERAKEVLQEIINKYSSYLELKGGPAIMKGDIDIQPNIFNIPKVYEMPNK